MSDHAKPLPRITPDNRPFWEACRQHRLELPFCGSCGKPHLPPGPLCPYCLSDDLEWRQASGRGRISTWVVVHKDWFEAFRDDLPYNVVQVELDESPRLTASVVGAAADQLQVGAPVEIVFDDVSDTLTLPRFRLL